MAAGRRVLFWPAEVAGGRGKAARVGQAWVGGKSEDAAKSERPRIDFPSVPTCTTSAPSPGIRFRNSFAEGSDDEAIISFV